MNRNLRRRRRRMLLAGGYTPIAEGVKLWLDVQDLSTMRQDRTGASATTPAAIGSPVGSWRNKGRLGGWLTAASDARRPTLRHDGTRYYLEFRSSNALSLPTPGFNLATIEMYLGINLISNAAVAAAGIVTFAPASGSDYNSNAAFTTYLNYTDHDFTVFGGSGSTMVASAPGMMHRPHLVEVLKPDNTSVTLRVDGTDVQTDSISDTFTTQTGDLVLGARVVGGTIGTFGNFDLYELVIHDAVIANKAKLRLYMEGELENAEPEYPAIADLTALTAARNTLISEVFSEAGGVLPSASATSALETPDPLNGIVTLTNLSACYKYTIPDYANRPRLWEPLAPREDVVVLLCAGHSVDWSGNALASIALQQLLTANIRVVTFVLPNGPNDYTSGGPSDHEAAAASTAEWMGPIVIAINKLKADYPNATIYIAGISGGGWMTTLAGAVDTRIQGSYQFVGTIPDYFYLNRDWEQRLPGLTADYLTLYLLASCPARRHKHILYENDPVGFNRALYNTRTDWSSTLVTQAAGLGVGDYDLVWVNYNQHVFEAVSYAAEFVAELPAFSASSNAINWGTDQTTCLSWGSSEITWGT